LGNRRQKEEVGSVQWRLKVVEEIRLWSRKILETPSDHYNGLPPCPFAHKAWTDQKVKISFGAKEEILAQCIEWNDNVELVIVVIEDWDWEDVEKWTEKENDNLKNVDLALMAFVPDSEATDSGQPIEEMENWEPLLDEPYAMVFIQRLSLVNAASDKLERAGYYKNCTAEFLEYINDRRTR